MPAAKKAIAKKTVAKKAAPVRRGPAVEARAFQRGTRQSPYKMRLVIDQIRGKDVNDALALHHGERRGAEPYRLERSDRAILG